MKTLFVTLFILVCLSCNKEDDCINGYAHARREYCPPNYKPVCGCDNVTYTNSCYAINADVSTWTDGECL